MIALIWRRWTGRRRPEIPTTWRDRLTEATSLRGAGHVEAAAMVARVALELRIREIARQFQVGRRGRPHSLPKRFASILRRLKADQVMDEPTIQTLRSLYAVTSHIAHGRTIERADALRAVKEIDATLRHLDGLVAIRADSAA
jgi:hypothetical protein